MVSGQVARWPGDRWQVARASGVSLKRALKMQLSCVDLTFDRRTLQSKVIAGNHFFWKSPIVVYIVKWGGPTSVLALEAIFEQYLFSNISLY